MELKLLKKGDKIISVNDKLIAVEHESGEISLIFYVIRKGKLSIQERVLIGYLNRAEAIDNETDGRLEVIHF